MTATTSLAQDAVLAVMGKSTGESVKVGAIADALHVSERDRPRLRRLLASMVDDDLLHKVGRGEYVLAAPAPKPSKAKKKVPAQKANKAPAKEAKKATAKAAKKATPVKATAKAAKKATPVKATAKAAKKAKAKAPTAKATAKKATAKKATAKKATAKKATAKASTAKGAKKATAKAPAAKAAKKAAAKATKPRTSARPARDGTKPAKGRARATRKPPVISPEVIAQEPLSITPEMAADEPALPARRPAPAAPAKAPARVIDERAVDPGRTGRITVHPAGYGFVEVEDGSDAIFVPAKYRGSALDGDRVVLDLWQGYKGREGRVVDVLSRGRAKLTGTLRRAGRVLYLEPDDPRIATDYGHVPLIDGPGRGQVGDAAVVEICHYPSADRPELVGRFLRVLGQPDDPRTEIEKILTCADIPAEFPEAALAQADDTPQELRPIDLADRVDLRDRPFVTIDPENARDFDDALCVETGPHGGPRVWIAVADVSHYVHTDDPLDREAVLRGVSVYLPDRVVPMLPFPLSAGICSLKPEVDRCAMVARLDMTRNGRIVARGLAAAVIRSHARLDYAGAAAALSGDFRGRREQYRQWAGALRQLDSLAQALRQRRMARGALDLDLPEVKVVLDEDDPRLVRDVVRAKGAEDVKPAYQLVEEFMIAANEAVGAFFAARDLPTVWRIHAPPEQERLHELARVLQTFGIAISDEMVAAAAKPKGMQQITAALGARPEVRALSFLVLRSLKQAVYDVTPVGHYGLASSEYVHFTSPIRRYADLLVHRLLKHYLHREGKPSGGGGRIPLIVKDRLEELSSATSEHERRAMAAEREAVSMYRAYVMRDQVGERIAGRVSAVTSFGAFVELDEPFVEGLIKLDAMGGDTFGYDAAGMRLRGRRSGLTLRLGDTVLVEIVDVSVTRRRIDLRLLSVAGRKVPEGQGHRRDRRGDRRDRKPGRRAARDQKRGEQQGGRRRRRMRRP